MTSTPPLPGALAPLRLLVLTMCGALLMLLFVATFIFMDFQEPWKLAPLWIAVAVGLPLVTGAIGRYLGRTAPALSAARGANLAARNALQARTILAAAIAESAGIFLFAVSFVIERGSLLLLALALPLSALGTFLAAWPSRERVRALQTRLEANGARTQLEESLFPGTSGSGRTGSGGDARLPV